MAIQVQVKEVVMYPDGRLDVKNAAAYTGFSEKTLAMMRCEGKGPKYVKRGRVFYFMEDLDAWLQEGRVVSTAQAACASLGLQGMNR
jgi:predicted DNA-binding transcriptional regulator AlpA